MLFYELACHPEVFSKQYLLQHNVAIKQIFKNIKEKGSIGNLQDGKWELTIKEKIATLDNDIIKEAKLKTQLQQILKILQTRKKFIFHKKVIDEMDWLKIIDKEKEDFSVILTMLTSSYTYAAEDLLDSKLWENMIKTSSEYATQDEEYIKHEIKPILHNAQQIDLIDPYFDITKEKYKKPFKIIVDLLSNNNIAKKVNLSIHIKNQNNNKADVIDRPKYLEQWHEIFKNNHCLQVECTLYVWKESDTDTMHDRYIIRDESFCAVLPSGIDERKKNRTVWSDIGYDNIDGILNDFRADSSPFKLVAQVTKEEICLVWKGVLQPKKNKENATIEQNINTRGGLKIVKRRR